MNANSIPFKVRIPSRGAARIGIAATSYEHLRQIVRHKYKVSGDFCLQQEDGTIVCDEDYFRLLEPRTTLTVVESPSRLQPLPPSLPLQRPPVATTPVVTSYALRTDNGWPCRTCPTAAPAVTGPSLLERKRCAPALDSLISPPKRYHPAYPPSHPYGAIHPQRTHILSHPPLHVVMPQLTTQQFRPAYPVGSAVHSFHGQQHQNSSLLPGFQPPASNQSLPGIYPLGPQPNCGGIPPNRVRPGFVRTGEANPNISSSLVAQLQITSVVGNVSMSPSPPKTVEPILKGPPPPPPPPLTLVPRPQLQRSPPWQGVSRLASPPHPRGRTPCGVMQRASPLCRLMDNGQLVSSTVQQKAPSSVLQQQLHQNEPSTTITHPSGQPQPQHKVTTTTDISSLLPPLADVAPTRHDSNRVVWKIHEGMSTTINSTPNPTPPPPPLQTPPSHPPENEKILSQPTPVAEMLEAMTEILEFTEPEKPVAELKVVSSSQQSTTSLSETDDSDEDRDEEENQLFIVEQVRPPSPDSTSSSQSVDQHEPLYHVPFARSPRPLSLGDRQYPIIIDADSATHETENEARNLCSPDEGYSSSTSPVDSGPHDFSSLLPFADYDEPSIPSEHLEKQRKGSNSEKTNRSGNPPEMYSKPKDTQMDLNSSADCYVGEETDEEDYEEDFVMDVDVFSPPLPVPPATTSESSGLVDRAAEIQQDVIRTDCDSGENQQLIVRIDRGRLSSAPAAIPLPTCSVQRHKPSRRYTVSFPLLAHHDLPQRRKRRGRPRSLDPTYRPGITLPTKNRPRVELNRALAKLRTKQPTEEHVPKLMVSIPVFCSEDGRIVCEEEMLEESDESVTMMELLASKFEEKACGEEGQRVPEIVRLEPHYPDDSEDSVDSFPARRTPEPTGEVAEFLTLPSVCSAVDLCTSVRELSDICSQLVCGGGGGGEEGDGGLEVVSLDVAEEVELAEPNTDTPCSPELTGMELLNLKSVQQESPPPFKQSALPRNHSRATVYCKDLAAQIEDLSPWQEGWRVHSLTHKADPRLRIQRYSLGNKDLFELSFVSGNWHLKPLHSNCHNTTSGNKHTSIITL